MLHRAAKNSREQRENQESEYFPTVLGALLVIIALPNVRRKRAEAFAEEG